MAVDPIQNKALEGAINQSSGSEFLAKFLPKMIGLGFVAGAVIFLFMFIIGALQWIISGGDKAKLENARARITSALVGLLILFALFAIVKLVGDFFCLNILQINLGPLKIDSTNGSVFGGGCISPPSGYIPGYNYGDTTLPPGIEQGY